jgi:3',5'-cyclic AMP phosphodiesterase CpdA
VRTLVHISDVHFGRVNHATVTPLIEGVGQLAPSLVVVSGDLTQRARSHEFREARALLDALPQPQLVVPGNHDVPLWNVFARFLAPVRNYRRNITTDLSPRYADDELIVQGLNTARSLTGKNGRISESQIALLRESFCQGPKTAVRVLVTHHPLDLPRRFDESHLVGRAHLAMPILAECGVDVMLAGHYHLAHTGDTTARYPIPGFSALVVHAGTTTSNRLRDDPNSFNLLHLAKHEIVVDRYTWRPDQSVFASQVTEHFRRTTDGWRRAADKAPHGDDIPVSEALLPPGEGAGTDA